MRRKEFDIHELSKTSAVSERSIRYYVQRKLLPSPKGTTRAAVYTDRHLQRLLDISRLRLAGRSLKEIKRILDAGPSRALTEVLRVRSRETKTRSYVSIGEGLWVCYDPLGPWRHERKLMEVVEAAAEAARKVSR